MSIVKFQKYLYIFYAEIIALNLVLCSANIELNIEGRSGNFPRETECYIKQ